MTKGIFLFFLFTIPTFASKSLIPPYQVITTKNGIEVYFFKSTHIPLFEVKLVFLQGRNSDPRGKSGLGVLSSLMISKGIQGMDENTISRKMDDLATGVETFMTDEYTFVSTYGLNQNVDSIISLMLQDISKLTFPEKPFQRIKANHIDHLKQLPDSLASLSSYVLSEILYNGTTHGRPSAGLKRELEKLTLEEVKMYYPQLFRSDRLKVLVVGGGDSKEVLNKIISGLEKLPCKSCGVQVGEPKKWLYPQWKVAPQHILLVKRVGVSEAHVRMGFLGPPRKVPEFYDLKVAETILSGSFNSRLNDVIRQKLNLTYSISAHFNFDRDVGDFSIATSTRNEKTGELIVQVKKLLKDFVEGDLTQEQMQAAKDYLIGSFPLNFENVYSIANMFFQSLLYDLEPTFLDTYRDRIREVTLPHLKKSIQKHFHLDQMKIVVVGDPKILAPTLQEKKLLFTERDPKDFL